MKLRAGHFRLDDGPSYTGYTAGSIWNGWACPYFTAEETYKLVEYWNNGFTPTTHAHYDSGTDTFVFYDDNVDEPDTFTGERHTVNGQTMHLYPVGNGCWVWEED